VAIGEGQTALVRPFRGEVDMPPKWPPIRAGPPLRCELPGRPFGGHIDFPPKHPNHSLIVANSANGISVLLMVPALFSWKMIFDGRWGYFSGIRVLFDRRWFS